MKKTTLIGTLLIGVITMSSAQKEMADLKSWTKESSEKIFKLRKFRKPSKKGEGTTPDLSKKDIKTVAFVSFLVHSNDGMNRILQNFEATSEGTAFVANALEEQSAENIESTFESQGYELLMPDEFTEDQKKALEDFTAKSMLGLNKDNTSSADGYKKIPTKADAFDYKLNQSLGELTALLGVDAILVVENQVSMPNKSSMELEQVTMRMYGENPIPKIEGKWYPGLAYNTGMCYADIYTKKMKEIPFIEYDRKAKQSQLLPLDGYENLLSIMSEYLIEDIETRKKELSE